eukprot:scaffold6110_cov70-Phaeocystis_antarctica.AAC.1
MAVPRPPCCERASLNIIFSTADSACASSSLCRKVPSSCRPYHSNVLQFSLSCSTMGFQATGLGRRE